MHQNTDWEKEFADYWFEGYNGKDTQGQEKFRKYVETFIHSLLQAREEYLWSSMNEMLVDSDKWSTLGFVLHTVGERTAYNQAIWDARGLINKK